MSTKKKVKKEKPKKKKLTNYNKQKYPSFNLNYQIPNRRDALEVDYLDKLSDKEKKYLNDFLQETVVTNFNHKGKQIVKNSQKKELYKENNKRNSDVYNKAKTEGKLKYGYGEVVDLSRNDSSDNKYNNIHSDYNDEEDAMLTYIEIKRNLDKIFKKDD